MKIVGEQTPSYYEVPNRRVDGFLGREDILHKVDEALSDGSGPHVAVLQGMGGQGKSQVALEYCHRKKNNPYSAIFWVDATTEDTVKASIQFISERIKRETDYFADINARVAFVLRMFTSWTVRWLIVFDNYDNPGDFPNIRDFIPQSGLGAILVTSRHPDSNALVLSQSNHFIELFGLEENAAVALITQRSQINEGISADVIKTVKRLGCHPLAVTQAGAYIRKRKLQLCDFMDHYKRRRKMILQHTPQLSQYRKKLGNTEKETSMNVFTTWELSFQQLQSQSSENEVEVKLLTLFAFFDERDISEQLFAEFNPDQERVSESAKLLVWLKTFTSADGQWESDLFEDVLLCLKDSSLLQAFARELDGFYHISLHPLIKDWIRLRTKKSICQENTYMAATLVKEILLNSWQKQHFDLALPTKQNILLHIIALEESYEEFSISQTCTLSIKTAFGEYTTSQFWFATFLESAGSYYLAAIVNQRLYAQNKKLLGPEHPSTLISMTDLASTYRYQGRWKEAEELEVQVMEARKRVPGPEHPRTLTSMANLAYTYWNQGRLKEAEELEVQVLEIRKKVLGLEHPVTLTSLANLASTFSDQGRLKEAEELEVQVLELRKKVLGLEHPDTLTSMSNLALTKWGLDRKSEAIRLMSEVVQYRRERNGSDHPKAVVPERTLQQWQARCKNNV